MLRLKLPGMLESPIDQLLQDLRVKRAFQIVDGLGAELMREHIAICEIPAPTFQESDRGEYFRTCFSVGSPGTELEFAL